MFFHTGFHFGMCVAPFIGFFFLAEIFEQTNELIDRTPVQMRSEK